MENRLLRAIFEEHINQIYSHPTKSAIENFFDKEPEHYRQILFNCDNNFHGKAERDIIITKVRILRILSDVIETLSQTDIQILVQKLSPLRKSIDDILSNGIIALCSQISEYKEYLSKKKSDSNLLEVYEEILGLLVTILRAHIILKQYQEHKKIQQIQNESENLIASPEIFENFSQKKISTRSSLVLNSSDRNIQTLTPDELIKRKIMNSVKSKTINELMNEYIRIEEAGVLGTYETCRICLQRIKLQNLDRHIDYCSKSSILNNRLEKIYQKKQQIFTKLRQILPKLECEQIEAEEPSEKTRFYEKQKIYKIVLKETKHNFRNQLKRSTMQAEHKSQKSILMIESYVDDHLEEYGDDEDLIRYKELLQEQKILVKKLERLQIALINNQQNVDLSENASFMGPLGQCKSFKTKKSLFCQKAASYAQSSRSSKKTFQDIEPYRKFKSIKMPCNEFAHSDSSSSNEIVNICKTMRELGIKQSCQINKLSDVKSEDFDFLKLLGKGAYGNVYLALRKKTNDLYAVKTIKIESNWGDEELELIKNQHEIFKKISSQYLVRAPFSFTEGACHFFVMEFVPGGDLGKILQREVYFQEDVAKIYLAEILLAIEALHESGIIHRDLKPQNLVIDERGHLKLTDFGLSKIRINDKLNKARMQSSSNSKLMQISQINEINENIEDENEEVSQQKKPIIEKEENIRILGTPDYIAPEIINNESLENQSIDWWSYGVIAYEMLVGCRPFCAMKVQDVIENIKNYRIEWPDIGDEENMISFTAASFIKSLMNPNYSERLGSNGPEQVKSHNFFTGIDWDKIRQQQAPLVPDIESKEQLSKLTPNIKYRSQIRNIIRNKPPKHRKLDKFVRYDLLMNETYESAEKNIEKSAFKLKQLKSIASNLNDENDKKLILSSSSQKSMKFEKWYKSEHTIALDMAGSIHNLIPSEEQSVQITYFDSNHWL